MFFHVSKLCFHIFAVEMPGSKTFWTTCGAENLWADAQLQTYASRIHKKLLCPKEIDLRDNYKYTQNFIFMSFISVAYSGYKREIS